MRRVNWRLVLCTLGLSIPYASAIVAGKRFEQELAIKQILPKKPSVFLAVADKQTPTTVTTHQSWFEKMGDAFKSVLAGLVLIWFSIPVMWINERRAARQESVIAVGKTEITNVEASEKLNEDNRGTLVRAHGGSAKSMLPVQDRRFEKVKMDNNCLRLRSTVEAFQWIEHKETKERKDNVGGGTTKETTFTYSTDWSGDRIDSSEFQDKSHINSVAIDELKLGSEVQTCDRVEYGESFVIPKDLVETLQDFEQIGDKFGQSLRYASYTFTKNGWFYYYPARNDPANVGDIRVKFEYRSDGPMTVMGLQVPSDAKDTFLPYRMISRGCCETISDEEKKKRLIAAGNKDAREMYEEDACDLGPLNVICCCCTCACNIVTCCFHSLLPPQVYKLFTGEVDEKDCWNRLETEAAAIKWILRLVGWLMMLSGTYALFQPLIVAFDIIPFLGPYMGSFVGWVIYILCFIVTAALASLIISIAYLIYHPLKGILYLVFACMLAAIPIAFSLYVKSQGKGS